MDFDISVYICSHETNGILCPRRPETAVDRYAVHGTMLLDLSISTHNILFSEHCKEDMLE
jgi:hypothetical protein